MNLTDALLASVPGVRLGKREAAVALAFVHAAWSGEAAPPPRPHWVHPLVSSRREVRPLPPLTSPLNPDPWREDAACAAEGVDLDWFFPPRTGTPYDAIRAVSKAKEICATCPVVSECLAYAVTNHINFGVWGARTPRERRPGRLGNALRCHLCGRLFDADSHRKYCSSECRSEATKTARREHMRRVRLE